MAVTFGYCRKGHLRTNETSRIEPHSGKRRCKICAQENHKKHYSKEASRIKMAEWRKSNPDKAIEHSRRYSEYRKEYLKMWRSNNKDKVNFYAMQYNNQKRANGGSFSQDEWVTLQSKYNFKCLSCGITPQRLTVDHVIPISLGGSNNIENIQPLCKSCNSKKQATILDFRGGD